VHGFHHPFEDGVEKLSRLLGITISEQLHRALQVSEQHRDLLALALQRGLGIDDAFGKVLWRVGLWRCEPRLGGRL
jgi:hypothetical protein